jgi:hypothetical protein
MQGKSEVRAEQVAKACRTLEVRVKPWAFIFSAWEPQKDFEYRKTVIW